MRRIAIGLVAGVAVWVAGAAAAEAQVIQIDPITPTAIAPSSSIASYCATLTPGSSNLIDVQLQVYVNSEPTPRFATSVGQYSIPGSMSYKMRVKLSGWNLQDGDVVRFHLSCWWDPTGQLTSNDYSITVSGS